MLEISIIYILLSYIRRDLFKHGYPATIPTQHISATYIPLLIILVLVFLFCCHVTVMRLSLPYENCRIGLLPNFLGFNARFEVPHNI
jgi:hypothetical protein